MKLLDLFAGTGVGVACESLGIMEYGVEIMPEAVASRNAAGFSTPYNDAWDIEAPEEMGLAFDTMWASPPCQTFSVAGKGVGRKALDEVIDALRGGHWKDISRLRGLAKNSEDDRTALVLVPLAYVRRYLPRYVVLEQVTPVLPVWEAYADEMRELGYSVWTGVLNSAEYGVPQIRKRAYLIARRDGVQAEPPAVVAGVSMKSIRPDQEGLISGTSTTSGGICIPGSKLPRSYRSIDQQAFTATSKVTTQRWYPSMEMVNEREAKMMQSYPADFPIQGGANARRLQIGNAVPPLVAEAVLRMFLPAGDA